VLAVAALTGAIYLLFAYHDLDQLKYCLAGGSVVALLFVLTFAFRGAYSVKQLVDDESQAQNIALIWNYAFFGLLITGLLTKSTVVYSRGWLILFYAIGLPALHVARVLVKRAAQWGLASGIVAPRSLLLVGTADSIARFRNHLGSNDTGLRVMMVALLPEHAGLDDAAFAGQIRAILEHTGARARDLGVDAVYILAAMNDGITIDCCLDVFAALPVSIHIAPAEFTDRFANLRIERAGGLITLGLSDPPLTPLDRLAKRMLDLCIAIPAFLVLAPVLTVVWALVRFDSKGPGFFVQRRHGYNQRAFKILKFRTMTTQDDGADIPQATHNDPRITRIGKVLRRWNIDELPQLLNVIKGDMSIVGPRPHAVAHDLEFEQKIRRYTRRLNMKPGITGWAQVNGLRGETDTSDKMRRRIAYDLYYIDHWSLRLDFYIIALTLLSPKSYRNAR